MVTKMEKTDIWLCFYFHSQEKSLIIHSFTRSKNKTETTFAFIGYKTGKGLGNWIHANKYFGGRKKQSPIYYITNTYIFS